MALRANKNLLSSWTRGINYVKHMFYIPTLCVQVLKALAFLAYIWDKL